MRPLTAQECYSCAAEVLPMGCCCSNNNKINPVLLEKRRQAHSKLKEEVFAPYKFAIKNIIPPTAPPFQNKTFNRGSSFGKLRSEPSSSEEFSEFELAEDIQKYNKGVSKKSRHGRSIIINKGSKTKGFDFPIFASIHGQGPDPAYVKGTSKSKVRTTVSSAGVVEKYHYQLQPQLKKEKRVTTNPIPTTISIPPINRLHYKRIKKRNFREDFDDEDSIDSDESGQHEEMPITVLERRGRGGILEKTVIAVKRKNGNEDFYEQTYSKNYPPTKYCAWPRQTTPDDFNVDFENNAEERSKRNKRLRRKNARARSQRLLDTYLAQPKALIVPIIRDGRKGKTVKFPRVENLSITQLESERPRRRILRKPWLFYPPQKSSLVMKPSESLNEDNRISNKLKVDSIHDLTPVTYPSPVRALRRRLDN